MNNSTILSIFSYDFIQNAMIGGVLASILCGILGVFIFLRRIIFIVGSLSHSSFAGIGLAYFFNYPPLLGALIFVVLAAIFFGSMKEERIKDLDSLMGIFWSFGMALGIFFLSLKEGFIPDLSGYLFGNILMISETGLMTMVTLLVVELFFLIFHYKKIIWITFDQEFAFLRGVSIWKFNLFFYLLVSLTIILVVEIVGIILVIALLTIAPLTAFKLTFSLKKAIGLSIFFNILFVIGGLLISFFWGGPSGALIIIFGVLVFGIINISINILRRYDHHLKY